MNEEKTLICPKCGAYSLEVNENNEEEESNFCYLSCFNCGFNVSDEEYQSMTFRDQERIDALSDENDLPDIIQDLNFNLLNEELERKIV